MMYLKIIEKNHKQFIFKINSLIAFTLISEPIKDSHISQAIRPYQDTDPNYNFFEKESEPMGIDSTSTITDSPEKIVYVSDDKGNFRIIQYSGTAYLVNEQAQTINKF